MRTLLIAGFAVLAAGCSNPAVPSAVTPAILDGFSQRVVRPTTGQYYLYSVNDGGSISAYKINGNGSLTQISGSPYYLGTQPTAMAISFTATSGTNAYVTDYNNNRVLGFSINPASGALTALPGSPYPAGSGPVAIAVDPSGSYVYVADEGSSDVYAYQVTSAGNLTQIGTPYGAGSQPSAIMITPVNDYLYVTNSSSNNISGWTISSATGALTSIAGSPFPTSSYPDAIATDYRAHWVYVPSSTGDDVSAYSIRRNGSLLGLSYSPFATGTAPAGIAMARVGHTVYAYISCSISGALFGYSIQATGPFAGHWHGVPTSPFTVGTNPKGVAVPTNSSWVYTANFGSNTISAKRIINQGKLQGITGSPYSTGSNSLPFSFASCVSNGTSCRP